MIPTFRKTIRTYLTAVDVERLKCGRPCKGTVRNTLAGVRHFMRWVNLHQSEIETQLKKHRPMLADVEDSYELMVSVISPRLLRMYLSGMLRDGVKPISAVSYVHQLRQLFAKWVIPYYEDHNWRIPPFPTIGTRPATPRYTRPSPDMLAKVRDWVLTHPTDSVWFAATMMLEFAMRNGDIMRLKRENFVRSQDRVFLNYTPNKTRYSSGRVVKWPIHPTIWEKMSELFTGNGDEPPVIDKEHTFDKLNQCMRDLGFTGNKGAYELRKICIDHIYQRFGAELATSISGDDIRTIIKYYADPAQPNIGDIRITDLL